MSPGAISTLERSTRRGPQHQTLALLAEALQLGVREQSTVAPVDTIGAAIARNTMLLVLDNCEHVLDECARIAEALLRECSGVVVLTTTREALRLDGECVVRVQPLPYDEADCRGPALDLLLQRLAEADITRYSRLLDGDRAQAASVCKRLDGIPLALELAAGRARELPLADIVAGLDERFGLLVHGRRTALPRQPTLRGMIDWSFAPLAPSDQELFA